jgi:demethylmenaquinone methyltransferase/2-methoxy-6-polyprenyl-1,4-benzoquinol methylase
MNAADLQTRPPTLRGLDQKAHLDSPSLKQHYVTTMFEIIAPRYDRFTRAFSFGMDATWKRDLVTMVRPHVATDSAVLDLACGTGDIAFALARWNPHGQVLGIDAAPTMIELARQAAGRNATRVAFAVGDLTALAMPDGCQDVVSLGYGLRNVPDLDHALGEIHRVLRPGGVIANLDFTLPESPLWRAVLLRYLLAMGNIYGALWHSDPAVYGYIARSIERFVTQRQLSAALSARGFEILTVTSKLGGGVSLHVARKRR